MYSMGNNDTTINVWSVVYMIRIKPLNGSYNEGFIIEGHADYAEHGRDIVCSAVSAIAQSTRIGLNRFSVVEAIERDGFMLVDIRQLSIQTFVLMYAFEESLSIIAGQYPDYITFEQGEIKRWEKQEDLKQ